ncbi:hypothetical protein LSAT2_026645 [Lamellibrachia satsuma]|nr:hypothetical protein LSAT2_026645 [Lamellibrachia satsuma]
MADLLKASFRGIRRTAGKESDAHCCYVVFRDYCGMPLTHTGSYKRRNDYDACFYRGSDTPRQHRVPSSSYKFPQCFLSTLRMPVTHHNDQGQFRLEVLLVNPKPATY